MRGIGRAYFDDETKNEFGFFSGVNDLYHMGDMLLNESLTVESYLKNFNIINRPNHLMFYGSNFASTCSIISINGRQIS